LSGNNQREICLPYSAVAYSLFSAEHGNIVGWFPHCQLIKIPC